MLKIGIISYLPDDEKLRGKRKAAMRKQTSWINSIFTNPVVEVVTQNYAEEDIKELEQYATTIYQFDSPIGVAGSRNVILEHFWNSDYDHLVLIDDDTLLYPYYQIQNFFEELNSNPMKFKEIDSCVPVDPSVTGFKKPIFNDEKNLTHYKFVKRNLGSDAAFFIVRNIVKHDGASPIYFKQFTKEEGAVVEDTEFILDWVRDGHTAYTLCTMIRDSSGIASSTVFPKDMTSRKELIQLSWEGLLQRNPDLKLKSSGDADWKSFRNKYDKTQKLIYIPRDKAIVLTDREIPKDLDEDVSSCNMKSLFI